MNREYQDIIIIGAGLSGIGAAYHISKKCPGKSLAILESRKNMGGTWDLFKYPGIRSDSDMFTLGYNFKPWKDKQSIADGPSILNYIKEAAKENALEDKIRYQHQVESIEWCSQTATWTLQLLIDGKPSSMTCNYLLSCTGYYNYDKGYTPEYKGKEDYQGQFIHPQQWPEDLDYRGKKIVVIGSGATAITLIPELAKTAGSVTMLQRSPTYVANVPKEEALAIKLRKYLPNKWVYRITRTRNVLRTMLQYKYCKAFPEKARAAITGFAKKQLGENVDIKHFTPKYNPWDERLCAAPGGDLFKVLRKGQAEIITDTIDTFTSTGIQLQSGDTLEADIVVSATGLDLKVMGGIAIKVDGQAFKISDSMVYRGILLDNLPNLGLVFGYTNASWTLKSDLISEYVCRVINHMDKTRTRKCTPLKKKGVANTPFIDMNSGYLNRAQEQMPSQGNKVPWRLHQNYLWDMIMLRFSRVNDGVLKFERAKAIPTSITQSETVKLAKAS